MGRKGRNRRGRGAQNDHASDNMTRDDKEKIFEEDSQIKIIENYQNADKSSIKDSSEDRNGIKFYPFAYALYNSELHNHCWYCLTESKSLRRCVGCNEGMYCSRECHLLGWKDHKFECKGLNRNGRMIPDIEVRLLGRIVIRYKAIKYGKDKSDPDFYLNRTSSRSIMDIWAHVDLMREDVAAMDKFKHVLNDLIEFYGAKSLLTEEEIFELHCRNYINRHAISDKAFLKEIGKGLYLDLCAYDHSCKPNSIYVCDGFTARLKALDTTTNLFDLTSTFYTYIDLLNTTEERRKQLKDSWYFDCQCLRCSDENDGLLSSILCPNCPKPKALRIFGSIPYKDRVTQIITCPDCNKEVPRDCVVEAIGAMQLIQRLIEKNEIEQVPSAQRTNFLEDLRTRFREFLPKVNVYLCRLIQLQISLTDPSNYEKLLELHLDAEECVRFCYPTNHPAVALHLKNIGLFYLKTGHPHRGKFYLDCSFEKFTFLLGAEHVMSHELEKMLIEAADEIELAKKMLRGSSSGLNKINLLMPIDKES